MLISRLQNICVQPPTLLAQPTYCCRWAPPMQEEHRRDLSPHFGKGRRAKASPRLRYGMRSFLFFLAYRNVTRPSSRQGGLVFILILNPHYTWQRKVLSPCPASSRMKNVGSNGSMALTSLREVQLLNLATPIVVHGKSEEPFQHQPNQPLL